MDSSRRVSLINVYSTGESLQRGIERFVRSQNDIDVDCHGSPPNHTGLLRLLARLLPPIGGGNKTYVALTWLEAQSKMSGKWLSLSH